MGLVSLQRLGRCGAVFAGGCALIAGARAQTATFDAAGLVRRAVEHRRDEAKSHRPLRYLLRKTDARREMAKEIVETKDGDVARLIEVDGKPLSADVEQAEMARLDELAAHPELQERRHRSEIRDEARVDRLMAMLPDAETYKLEGIEPCSGGRCYRMSFAPNPAFAPPDMESDLLRGFAGEVWIDQAQERLTRLEAHLIADVDFGFGIVGRLDKGGTVEMRQTDVGGGEWELTGLKVRMEGKALLVKSLSVQLEEETSGFVPVPVDMGYRDAIALLKRREPVGASQR